MTSKISSSFGLLLLLCLTNCGGNSTNTAQGLLEINPSATLIAQDQCVTTVALTNTSGAALQLLGLFIELTGQSSQTRSTQTIDPAGIAALVGTTTFDIGAQLTGDLSIDVAAFAGETQVSANLLFLAADSQGATVSFAATLTCNVS